MLSFLSGFSEWHEEVMEELLDLALPWSVSDGAVYTWSCLTCRGREAEYPLPGSISIHMDENGTGEVRSSMYVQAEFMYSLSEY